MYQFSKFEVLNWLKLSRKQISTFKSVKLKVYILAVIDNCISHMG